MISSLRQRLAYTLLELLAATAITGVVLITTLALIRDSMALSRRVEVRNNLTTLGVSKMEEHLARAAATFQPGTFSGDFSSEGHPFLRFRVERSDSPQEGGIPGRLMSLTATVWHDENRNSAPNADELSVVYSSKVAKLLSD